MPATPKFAIPYPDGSSNYAPLQDWFAGIANGAENAITTGLGGAPRLANSDSERAALFPNPVQGNAVLRPDKGYTEQYFGLFNTSTNPSGATPAGWYPVSGNMPHHILKGKTMSAVAVTGSAWHLIDFATYFDVDSTSGHFPTPSAGYLFKGSLPGRYQLQVDITFGGANPTTIHTLKKNSVSADSVGGFAKQNNSVAGNTGGMSMTTEVFLAANDSVSLADWFSISGASYDTNPTTWSASCRFIAPINK